MHVNGVESAKRFMTPMSTALTCMSCDSYVYSADIHVPMHSAGARARARPPPPAAPPPAAPPPAAPPSPPPPPAPPPRPRRSAPPLPPPFPPLLPATLPPLLSPPATARCRRRRRAPRRRGSYPSAPICFSPSAAAVAPPLVPQHRRPHAHSAWPSAWLPRAETRQQPVRLGAGLCRAAAQRSRPPCVAASAPARAPRPDQTGLVWARPVCPRSPEIAMDAD